MEEKIFNIDPFQLLRPMITATLVNAFYSALILKKLSGTELNDDIKIQTFVDLLHLYGELDHEVVKILEGHSQGSQKNQDSEE